MSNNIEKLGIPQNEINLIKDLELIADNLNLEKPYYMEFNDFIAGDSLLPIYYTVENKRIIGFYLNNLDKQKVFPIPLSITNLTKLRYLFIYNFILEDIERWLPHLVNLEHLLLDSTGLKYLPKSIEKLTHLVSLDLHNNLLTFLPNNIDKLEKLEDLNLNDNNLKSLPDTIIYLKKIESIATYGNDNLQITENINEWLEKINKQ